MNEPAAYVVPLHPRISRSGSGIALAITALGWLSLGACLQTGPDGDSPGKETLSPLEDNGRRAGASSSTNWPAEMTTPNVHKVYWSSDSILKLPFFEFLQVLPGGDIPVTRSGKVRLFKSGVIPSLDSIKSMEWDFQETDTLKIPFSKIDSLGKDLEDTLFFNVQIESDTLQAWLQGFGYSKKMKKIIQSPTSAYPANPVFMRVARFYFRGSVADISGLLPPSLGNNPELSFYIPGTPIFCKAQLDSFELGPFPRGTFPLRVMRASNPGGPMSGTSVEAWELRVTGTGSASMFNLGEQVLAFQSKGTLTLRNGP